MRKLDETQVSKVARFLNDPITSDIIFELLRDSFLKPRNNKEVHYLAAKSLAHEFLEEAWKDLDKHRSALDTEDKSGVQVAL